MDVDERSAHRTGRNYFGTSCNAMLFLKANSNQIDQLICYYNLLSRQSNFNNIAQLTDLECDVLLDWDQEKYRQNLSKQI